MGTAVAQWLRYCATNQKVAGSIPDGVMEFFSRTLALGSTQPLTEMSTRCNSWGKCGRCVRLTTLQPSCAVVKKSGNLNFLEHSGPPQACNGTAFGRCMHRWEGDIYMELKSIGCDIVGLIYGPGNISVQSSREHSSLYKVIQEESSLFWEVLFSV
jgi:hypothetical protein